MVRSIRIVHTASGTTLAEGALGWDITPFEGNYYISRKCLRTRAFRVNYIPGICIYKFLYVWLDLHLDDGVKVRGLGWLYWLPNPLLPFIWFRVAVPRGHPELTIDESVSSHQAPHRPRRVTSCGEDARSPGERDERHESC